MLLELWDLFGKLPWKLWSLSPPENLLCTGKQLVRRVLRGNQTMVQPLTLQAKAKGVGVWSQYLSAPRPT